MLNFKVQPVDERPASEEANQKLTAIISISAPVNSGQPNHGIILEIPEKLAFQVAVAFLGDPLSVNMPMVEDACGETVNMIAGNLKKHIARTHTLSMPAVVRGTDYRWCVPSLRLVQEHLFSCDGHVFKVSLGQETPRRPAP